VTAERDRLISLLDSQDPSYLVLKSQVEGLTAERERLALLLSAQEPSYQTLRDRLETTSIERDRLTALLAEQSPSYEVLEAQLEEVILRLERCETARGTLSEELARLQGVVRENNAFIDGQRAQLDAQEVYIARLITGGITAAEIEAYCQTR
jgi:predicted nuclease with TOPRIM domain